MISRAISFVSCELSCQLADGPESRGQQTGLGVLCVVTVMSLLSRGETPMSRQLLDGIGQGDGMGLWHIYVSRAGLLLTEFGRHLWLLDSHIRAHAETLYIVYRPPRP
jgi:hypothetical protein